MHFHQLFVAATLATSALAVPLTVGPQVTDPAEIQAIVDDFWSRPEHKPGHRPDDRPVTSKPKPLQSEGPWTAVKSAQDARGWIQGPPANKGIFWSRVGLKKAQNYANNHSYQTLDMSVSEEILRGGKAQLIRSGVWKHLFQAYVEQIVDNSVEVTMLLGAPRQNLTGPSDPLEDGRIPKVADLAKIALPALKNKTDMKIYAMHIDARGLAGEDRYEMWPNDKAYVWQAKHNITIPAPRPIKPIKPSMPSKAIKPTCTRPALWEGIEDPCIRE